MPLLPRPYPDEVIGSVIVRTCVRSGISRKRILTDIAGTQRSYNSFLVSTGLQRIGVLSGTDPDELLLKHTMFPYAVAVMPQAMRTMLRDKALRPTMGLDCLGSMTKNVSHGVHYRRICPMCVAYDLRTYGESYWHRSHLLPAVWTCNIHSVMLQETMVPLRGHVQSPTMLLPHELPSTIPEIHVPNIILEHLNRVSIDMLAGSTSNPATLASQYREKALSLGYKMVSGDVAGLVFANALWKHFSPSLLEGAGCEFKEGKRNTWPALMLRECIQEAFTTAKHVLMQTFLETATPTSLVHAAHYERPGKKLQDHRQLDLLAANQIAIILKTAFQTGRRFTVKELLSEIGAWEQFRHNRQRFPRTCALIEAFRTSDQSERQVGKRERWRKEPPKKNA